MSDKRVASITPPNKAYPREELEEMMERWLKANGPSLFSAFG